jgi:hypothetical protein
MPSDEKMYWEIDVGGLEWSSKSGPNGSPASLFAPLE